MLVVQLGQHFGKVGQGPAWVWGVVLSCMVKPHSSMTRTSLVLMGSKMNSVEAAEQWLTHLRDERLSKLPF